MAMTINTNMASLNAQRNLTKTQSALNVSLGRLSSGLRINSAKDDAAGMAISNRFSAQIRGMDQAVRNANDGISMLQTSEGGMQEVTTILQRMRELSVQASNDTNSASDRASLQSEMDSLFSEIDRISGSTKFNGVGLLDGSGGTKTLQIGANSGENISVTLKSTKTKDLNLNGYSGLGELNSGRVNLGSGASNLRINDTQIATTFGATNTAKTAAAAINLKTGTTGVTATAYNTYKGVGGGTGITDGTLKINNSTVGASGNMSELVDNINRDVSGVTAALNADGSITLSNNTGDNISITGTSVGGSGFTKNDVAGTTAPTAYRGYLSLSSADGSEIAVTASAVGTIATSTQKAGVGTWGFNVSTGSKLIEGSSAGAISQTAASNAFAEGELSINGVKIGASSSASAGDKAVAINAVKDKTGVTAQGKTTVSYTLDMANITAMTADSQFKINQSSITGINGATSLSQVVTKINDMNLGINASADIYGKLVLTSESGQDIKLNVDVAATINGAASYTRGTLTLTSDTGVDIKISGTAGANGGLAKAGLVEQGGSDAAIGSGLSLSSVANANNAINRIDDALNKVAENRSDLGAIQNRLDSTISNLQNGSENFSAANGRIMDADFAKETANMSKQQIMMQAGVAMLAQAKQLPQQVLQLLQ